MNIIRFKKELNFNFNEYNHVADISELLINGKKIPVIMNYNDNDEVILRANVIYKFRECDENILIKIAFNKEKLLYIEVETNDSEGKYNEVDLKHFYYEEIQDKLYEFRNLNKYKYTIRNYRLIYNLSAIKGQYQIAGKNKFSFFSLYDVDSIEPMTEQIVAFDVEVEETSLDRARSKVHNLVSDYCAFLSVLLDVGFEDVKAKKINFVKKDARRNLITDRYRTGFFDKNLEFIVKDNLNGLTHIKDNENLFQGFVSCSAENIAMTEKMGNAKFLEETLQKHRIYKTQIESKCEYIDNININIHYANEPISIPKQIRNYFRGIFDVELSNYEKYKCFRNSCRLYNLSHYVGKYSATSSLSYMVVAVEALAKNEKISYIQFIKKYNKEADMNLLDYIYGKVRSGHFHSGEFCFREYNIQLNISANRDFFEIRNDYLKSKQQLRVTIISWINSEILKIKD